MRLPRDYQGLEKLFPLNSIVYEKKYDRAIEIAGNLFSLPRLTKDQIKYLEQLSIFIKEYEELHHQINTSDLEGLSKKELLKGIL